jgi:hypothetical protein
MTADRKILVLAATLAALHLGCRRTPSDPPAQPTPSSHPASAPHPVGGPCSYVDVAGTITVTSITKPSADQFACPNGGVSVAVLFTPDDPAKVPATYASGEHGRQGTITIGGGEAPPSSCLAPLGITQGATLRGVESFETNGTCAPIVLKPAVDLSSCQTACN